MAKAKTQKDNPAPTVTATAEPSAKPARLNRAPIVEAVAAVKQDDDFNPFDLAAPEAPAEPDKAAAELAPSSPPPGDETPPPPVTPTVIKHSRRLLNEALEWGFSQTFIDSTPSDELDGLLYERQRAARIEAQKQAEAGQRKHEAPKQEVTEPEVKLPFEDQVSPEIAEWMKAQERERKRIEKEYGEKLAAMEQREMAREVRSIRQRWEALLEKHKDAVDNEYKRTALGAILQAKNSPETLEADFVEGLKNLGFVAATSTPPASPPKAQQPEPKPAPEPEPDPLKERKDQFLQGGVARPTARTAIELPPGEEKALRNLKERLGAMTAQPLSQAEKKAEMDDIFGD